MFEILTVYCAADCCLSKLEYKYDSFLSDWSDAFFLSFFVSTFRRTGNTTRVRNIKKRKQPWRQGGRLGPPMDPEESRPSYVVNCVMYRVLGLTLMPPISGEPNTRRLVMFICSLLTSYISEGAGSCHVSSCGLCQFSSFKLTFSNIPLFLCHSCKGGKTSHQAWQTYSLHWTSVGEFCPSYNKLHKWETCSINLRVCLGFDRFNPGCNTQTLGCDHHGQNSPTNQETSSHQNNADL